MAIVTLLVAALVTSCGVRLETPPPSEPVPDAEEVLRESAVVDALTVAELATGAALTAEDAGDDELAAALVEVAAGSARHAEQLGGLYDSGLEPDPGALADTSPDGSPDATDGTGATDEAGADVPPTASPTDVVDALAGASLRSRVSADTTEDGGLARLLASVSAAQDDAARRVSALADVEDGAHQVDVEAEIAVPRSDGTTGGALVPESLPGGLSTTDLTTIVAAEDAAGYAYEVRAALADGALRERALARAAVHRQRAQAWADAGGIAAGDQDPRRVAYALADDPDTDVLAQQLEGALAASYASLVGAAVPGSRAPLVDLLTDSAGSRVAWGGEHLAFPGLPEAS